MKKRAADGESVSVAVTLSLGEAETARRRQLHLRLSEAEETRFQAVAKSFGLSVSSMVRHLVQREARALQLDAAQSREDLLGLIRPLRTAHEAHDLRERMDPTCPFCTGDIT